jgi:hypothetical protein
LELDFGTEMILIRIISFLGFPTYIYRSTNETDALPDDLRTPVAVADGLFHSDVTKSHSYSSQTSLVDGMNRSLGDPTENPSEGSTEPSGEEHNQSGELVSPFLKLNKRWR